MSKHNRVPARVRPVTSCKKHPGIPAVKDGLCMSCRSFVELGEKIKKRNAGGK